MDHDLPSFMATEIHGYLRSDLRHGEHFLPSPFFIEVFGNPDSGKSSAIKSLYIFLRRHGFRVKKPLEGAEEISDDIPRSTPEFNLATGIYATDFLIRLHHAHTHDVVILDRGIFDAYSQMSSWHKKGKLSTEERDAYQAFFLSKLWTPRVTACFVMVCDPKVAIERTMQESRTTVLGGSTTPESIMAMRDSCIETYEALKDKYPLHLIDTSALTVAGVADMMNTLVLEKLLQHTRARRDMKD
jgi:thymidylate kinase